MSTLPDPLDERQQELVDLVWSQFSTTAWSPKYQWVAHMMRHNGFDAAETIAAVRAPVEHGFAALKNWRILTRLRLNPARATHPATSPARPDEPRNQPLTDDLERGHPPANSASTHKPGHTTTLSS